jgi:dTDP-4-dehydrorhamnose reductase
MSLRALVTGAGGMLGQDLLHAAAGAATQATGLTHSELDVTDLAAVRDAVAAIRPEVVVNCAAWTDVDGAEAALEPALTINGEGAGNVARAAREAAAWTIQISSDYVFDGAKREPYVESDPTGPLSAYGRSKLAGEQSVAREAPHSHTIVRSSWLFGIHGHCFPATIMRLAAERNELTVVDDQRGCPTFTGHLADALVTLAQSRPLGILHVAGGGSCSWFEFARAIVAATGHDAEVLPGRTADQGRPAPRPAYSVLGTERQGEAPALPDWRTGLEEYLAATAAIGQGAPRR